MNERLMEEILDLDNLRAAYKAVKANDGAPGVDGMSVREFGESFAGCWETIKSKLLAGSYVPGAVRGVEIPKKSGGTRLLGIPNVQDRVIQQAMGQKLSAIFEEKFSEHSYGFRPGRSAHDAVRAAKEYVKAGKEWVIDIDLKAFFDQVDHDILMREVALEVRDKAVLKTIGSYLRAPMKIGEQKVGRNKGTPQGGPLSPLLANIYLHPLDVELEARELSFVRYADDIAIYAGSERSAKRILESVVQWLKKKLKLEVNVEKSQAGPSDQSGLLGFRIYRDGRVGVSPKAIARLKEEVREKWDGRRSLSSRELRDDWRRYIDGWWNYFQEADWRREVEDLSGWIRRHIRKCFWLRWHGRKGRKRHLYALGVRGKALNAAHSSQGAWPLAACRTLQAALNNKTLTRYGLNLPWSIAAS
jgi:RNA-directed DNA polymerase